MPYLPTVEDIEEWKREVGEETDIELVEEEEEPLVEPK
jgi:hypothetical protein